MEIAKELKLSIQIMRTIYLKSNLLKLKKIHFSRRWLMTDLYLEINKAEFGMYLNYAR